VSQKESNQITKRQALPDSYPVFLQELKQRIRESQVRASVSVNRELVLLYWRIGNDILVRQQRENWGAKVIDRLAADLKKAFPDMKGFSPRNLKYMRAFAEAWPSEEFVQEVLAQITWYHNLTLLEKLATESDRIWYARSSIQHGWSRNVLVHQIETALHKRAGAAVTNFERTLPPPQSDLTQQITKDPYTFDFPDARPGCPRTRARTGSAGTPQGFPAGIGRRLRFRGEPVSAGHWRK
jgi:predicted nuclease of restriction endonuclease-like (RecB) superfamily